MILAHVTHQPAALGQSLAELGREHLQRLAEHAHFHQALRGQHDVREQRWIGALTSPVCKPDKLVLHQPRDECSRLVGLANGEQHQRTVPDGRADRPMRPQDAVLHLRQVEGRIGRRRCGIEPRNMVAPRVVPVERLCVVRDDQVLPAIGICRNGLLEAFEDRVPIKQDVARDPDQAVTLVFQRRIADLAGHPFGRVVIGQLVQDVERFERQRNRLLPVKAARFARVVLGICHRVHRQPGITLGRLLRFDTRSLRPFKAREILLVAHGHAGRVVEDGAVHLVVAHPLHIFRKAVLGGRHVAFAIAEQQVEKRTEWPPDLPHVCTWRKNQQRIAASLARLAAWLKINR